MDKLIFILEIIGVVASGISGAFTAIRKEMDLFGVAILGLMTATGGGFIRDLVLGSTPPRMFRDPTYAVIALSVSVLTFVLVSLHKLHYSSRLYEKLLLMMDTIGLAAYTAAGMGVAYGQEESYSLFLVIFVGVITGVGGGVMRDLFAGDRPYIFVKHVYASASLLGAVVCVILRPLIGMNWSLLVCMLLIVVIRLLSAHYRWNLPKTKLDE